MLLQSAVAVEREMVGKDSDGVLIGGVVELRNNCSCALLAASNAAAADCASAFDLGVVEKNCAILLGFPETVLNRLPPFSVGGEKDGQGVEGALLGKGFDDRRGMARGALEERCWKRPLDRRGADGICLAQTKRVDWCANVSVWRSNIDLVATRVPSVRRKESAVPKTKIIATVNALGTGLVAEQSSLQESEDMHTFSNCVMSRSVGSVTRSQLADPLHPSATGQADI